MVKRTVNAGETEPEQKKFDLPSEKEHLFQVADIYDINNNEYNLPIDDRDTVYVKCEVVNGDEAGRTLLNRLSLDPEFKGFFAMRLFLKAIGLPHKGEIEIDTDDFQGRQFYATVVHRDGFANIKEYNFEKMVEEVDTKPDKTKPVDKEIAWDE